MIYTVTLNPALDYVVQIDDFSSGKLNRNRTEHLYFGGKGVNVSCILKELGFESTALGFIAGFTGTALNQGLQSLGIHTDFIEVAEGMTRINVKIKSEDETEINGTGPLIREEDFLTLLEKLRNLGKEDCLIISGSIPSCMESDTYKRILSAVSDDVRIIADAERKLLTGILRYRPFLIKPNLHELEEIFDVTIRTDEEIASYACKLQEAGAVNVLVSMAAQGALLLDEHGTVHRRGCASGTVVNSVGAGDSMVAGFLAGYLRSNDYDEALKLGTACGGATAFHSGLAKRAEIEEILSTLE